MNEENSFYTVEEALSRYEAKKRRQLSDMAIRNVDPSYRVEPDEEIVDISEGEE